MSSTNTATPPTAASDPGAGESGQPQLSPGQLAAQQAAGMSAEEMQMTRRQRADHVRAAMKYRGRLTKRLLAELEWILAEATPEQWVIPVSETRRNRSVQQHYQEAYLDDTLGRAHWRSLIHYEDGGTTARAVVVIGNNLAGNVRLDPISGELINDGPAEIHASRETYGGISRSESKSLLLMGTETTVLRRVLAKVGPGRDILGAVQPDGATSQRSASVVQLDDYRPDLAGVAGIGDRKADELQIKLLTSLSRERNLPASQVANLIRRAAGAAQVNHRSETAAQRYVDRMLNDRKIVLEFAMFTPLRRLLESAEAQPPISAPPGGSGGPDGEPGESEGRVPFEPGSQTAVA
jgi:hypothetical protein